MQVRLYGYLVARGQIFTFIILHKPISGYPVGVFFFFVFLYWFANTVINETIYCFFNCIYNDFTCPTFNIYFLYCGQSNLSSCLNYFLSVPSYSTPLESKKKQNIAVPSTWINFNRQTCPIHPQEKRRLLKKTNTRMCKIYQLFPIIRLRELFFGRFDIKYLQD